MYKANNQISTAYEQSEYDITIVLMRDKYIHVM